MAGRSFTSSEVMALGAYVVFVRKSGTSYGAQVMAADDLIRSWLPEAQHALWDEALNATTDLDDLLTVTNELIEAATNRPTRAPGS